VVELFAEGGLPGGPAAVGQGLGVAEKVDGTAEIFVDDFTSASSVALLASGGGTTNIPTPIRNPPPRQTIKPQTPQVIYKPAPAQKQYYYADTKCVGIKDDKCYKIDDYEKCGFCVIEKYPVKGYACKYVEELVAKKGDSSSKSYVYETVLTPLCDCAGVFILKGESCHYCDVLLNKLLKCAGVKDPKKEIAVEIPEKCLKAVGVTEKELIKCGYIQTNKKDVVSKKKDPVVVLDPKYEYPKQQVVVVYDPVFVADPAYATAVATATAFGGATATANAVATASSKGF